MVLQNLLQLVDPHLGELRLTQKMFEKRLVLLPDAVERGPVGPTIRKRILPHPASTGKLVEVLTRVSAAVHCLHHLTGHCDTCLRKAQSTASICRRQEGNSNIYCSQTGDLLSSPEWNPSPRTNRQASRARRVTSKRTNSKTSNRVLLPRTSTPPFLKPT